MKDEKGLAIIIGQGGKPEMGGECNVLHLDERAYPDAQDGEEVETTVKGKLSIKDGVKTLQVTEADGLPVAGKQAPTEPTEEAEDVSEEEDLDKNLSSGLGKVYGEEEEELGGAD